MSGPTRTGAIGPHTISSPASKNACRGPDLEIDAQDDDEEDCDGSGSGWTADDCLRAGADQAGPAAPVTYDNKYEVYGGLNFMNFMAGQDLTRRMDFGGGEIEGTYWLTASGGWRRSIAARRERRRCCRMRASMEFTVRWCT